VKIPIERPLLVLSQVATILSELDIRYVLVGSFASSMHGMYRTTADIDIVAEVKPKHIHPLLKALEGGFYVDDLAVRNAIEGRGSFNAIHFESVFKIDIFIPKGDPFSLSQLERRQPRKISTDSDQIIYVATAEDTILAKLSWYRKGNEISSTQWSDVVGMIATATGLERPYLDEWARKLGVSDLLEKACQDAQTFE
jgi:hypothetical protein